MLLDKKLDQLPLTKSKPDTLKHLFGNTNTIPMWVADMDFEIDPTIQKALIERITNSSLAYEYKPSSYFKAQKKWYKDQYGVNLNQLDIIFSPSITTSISIIIENFTSEKDGIIIQPPVFMEFRDVIRNTKRRVTKNILQLINGCYQIDFTDLEKKAKDENNKIMILCNPHNPVGRVWKIKELKRIVNICKENNIILIADEIHKDIVFYNNEFTSILKFLKDWDKIIVCHSEAKTFNLAGISDSIAIIPNEALRSSVKTIFKKYNLGRTNALTRTAIETAYKKGDIWLKKLNKTIENNVNSIEEELIKSKSKIKLIKPEGTYQVWLDLRGIFSDSKEMFSHVTNKSGIGLNAGHWFGREGALFIRMNIATSNEKILFAINKIIKSVV